MGAPHVVPSTPLHVLTVLTLLVLSLVATATASATDCPAGQFAIEGTVTDESTDLPLDVVTSVGFGVDDQNTILPSSTFSICLPAGSYVVSFFADGYFLEWHNDAETASQATPVTGASGDHIVVDAALTPWPVITGQVTDRSGAPLFASVGLTDATAFPGGLDGEGTDANGVYRFVLDPAFFPIPGSYLVNYSADFHWSEWYDNANKRSRATVISVTRDSGVISGIDAELRNCGRPAPDFCIPRNFNR